MWPKAIIMAITAPPTIAAMTPASQLPVKKLTATAVKAPTSIIPSVPIFKILACWVMAAQRAA